MSLLWKPASDKGGLVILFPNEPGEVIIRDASTGEVLEVGNNTGASNDRAATIRFSQPGSAYNNVIVETSNGGSFFIDNGAVRRDNISLTPAGETPSAPSGNADPGGPGDLSNGAGGAAGGIGGGLIPGINGVAFPFAIDPNLVQPFPVEFPLVPQPGFNFTDPLLSAAQTGNFNREQSGINFELAKERAAELQEAELESIKQFASGISEFQRDLVGQENDFNQRERLDAAEFAIPGVQRDLSDQRERARTLASGRLLKDSEDRAIELAARSASADGTLARGFGDDSVLGARSSDLLSAQQRLDISQTGESLLSNSINQAAGLLFDTPLKSAISQGLPSQPNIPFVNVAGQQQNTLDQLTTIAPQTALASTVSQEQFQTSLQQTTDQFNANGNFSAQTFNSNQFYQAQLDRLGILAGNLQREQAFNQNVLNQGAALAEQEANQARFDDALASYQENKDDAAFIRSIAAIFGASNIPSFIKDQLKAIGGSLYESAKDFFGFGDDGEDTGEGTGEDAGPDRADPLDPNGDDDFTGQTNQPDGGVDTDDDGISDEQGPDFGGEITDDGGVDTDGDGISEEQGPATQEDSFETNSRIALSNTIVFGFDGDTQKLTIKGLPPKNFDPTAAAGSEYRFRSGANISLSAALIRELRGLG